MKNLFLIVAVLLTVAICSTAYAAPCSGGRCPMPSFSYDTATPLPPVVAPPIPSLKVDVAAEVEQEAVSEGPRRPVLKAIVKAPKAVAKGVRGLAKIRPLKAVARLFGRRR